MSRDLGKERGTNRKHACVDLTGGFRENGFVVGQATLKAELKKVEKHAKACEDNQHAFVPLAFDTSATWRRRQFGSWLEFSV
ncbi:putative exostosin [Helianthus annuus]|nr:putative exostosin [Helianthus annuus]KAJ0619209.1 putative exostosin [Helianthus annuus]